MEKCIATLFKKHVLRDSYFLFNSVQIMEGEYDFTKDQFIDQFNHRYDSIQNADSILTTDEFFFGNPVLLCQLKETYQASSLEEAKEAYGIEADYLIYIGKITNHQIKNKALDLCEIHEPVISQKKNSNNIESYPLSKEKIKEPSKQEEKVDVLFAEVETLDKKPSEWQKLK